MLVYLEILNKLRSNWGGGNFIKEKIYLALNLKPKKHDFIIEKNTKPYLKRHMNVTGG